MEAITPIGLMDAIFERKLKMVDAARLAHTTTKVLYGFLNGDPVQLGPLKRICDVFGFEDPDPKPAQWRVESEAHMRDRVAKELRACGYYAAEEYRLPSGNIIDLMVWNDRENKSVAYIVEAKISDALDGVGQLLAYQIEIGVDAPLVLLIRSDCHSAILERVCSKVGISLWVDKMNGKKEIPHIISIKPPTLDSTI